jgi:hypothetical protein
VKRLHSAWIALAVLAGLAPTLARTPQNGDGAEILNTALRGGVMHPPGFPLQAWLDRLVVLIPHLNPATAIAGLGLLAHACAAGLVASILRRLGVGPAGRVLGAAAFALYPPIWAVSVEPEVFALAHLATAAMLWLAVRIVLGPPGAPATRPMIALALAGALGLTTHPIVIPAIAMALGTILAPGRRRGFPISLKVGFAAALVLPALALYLSLPLLRTHSIWPDWGSLKTPGDVLGHMLRREYGTFSLSAAQGPETLSGLPVLLQDAWRAWSVALLLFAIGFVELFRRRALRQVCRPLWEVLFAGLGLVGIARLPVQTYSAAVLARLEGPVVIAGAVFIGYGFEALRGALRSAEARACADVAAALAIAAALVTGWREADVSRDATLALHAAGIALELPDGAVYVTEGDVETFQGVLMQTGLRFPVSGPEITPEWYWRDVVPKLEPRVMQPGVVVNQWCDFLSACTARGLAVASTSPTLIASPDATPELRGLIFVARAGSDSELTAASVAAAARLAPLAEALPRLPARGHAFSRFYARRFARAYAGAAEALRRKGDPALAAGADSVADAINRDAPVAERASLLHSFVARCPRR